VTSPRPAVLLTGPTGYIGGRLLSKLQARSEAVRCLARSPEHLEGRLEGGSEAVKGDLLDAPSLQKAFDGIETAYYLVHSMASTGSFEENDRKAAENFAQAARDAGVRRIIYLGGLGEGDDLSAHLSSRQEVGNVLRSTGVQVIELRASIVIGSGSLSFEMVRALVDRLPVMITPRWVRVRAQPIAIEDVLAYLVEAKDKSFEGSQIFEIGGPRPASYGEIMIEYAHQRGLRRLMIPVPILTPHLSSLWLGLVTPLYARVGRKLVDSMRNETVVRDDRALREFDVRPRDIRQAVERALRNEDFEMAETRWSDALSSKGEYQPYGGERFGTRLVDSRTARVNAPPEKAFAVLEGIGGKTGWYGNEWMWRARGFLDLIVGGPGMRRGRRDPRQVRRGDALDFWRVDEVKRPAGGQQGVLRLRAEMKLPGRAWLQFDVEPSSQGRTTIRQTAIFDPIGLSGLAYWYGLYPVHSLVFGRMIRAIARATNHTETSA
jgi:uncharacterized protein YbjT (DUF2867 family)